MDSHARQIAKDASIVGGATLLSRILGFFRDVIVAYVLGAGLTAYMAICALGAIVNVQSADYLCDHSIPWWFAGAAGALIGAVWNYAVSTQIVWTWLPSLFQKRLP